MSTLARLVDYSHDLSCLIVAIAQYYPLSLLLLAARVSFSLGSHRCRRRCWTIGGVICDSNELAGTNARRMMSFRERCSHHDQSSQGHEVQMCPRQTLALSQRGHCF